MVIIAVVYIIVLPVAAPQFLVIAEVCRNPVLINGVCDDVTRVYAVGERVTCRCTNTAGVGTMECLNRGEWSDIGDIGCVGKVHNETKLVWQMPLSIEIHFVSKC